MSERVDLTGKHYGRWTVLGYDEEKKKWHCKCQCGTERYIGTGHLNTGHTTSCGCYHRELLSGKPIAIHHGDSHTPLYMVWKSMKRRCYAPKCASYKRYGGRGITVCDAWQEWLPFKEWALANGYAEGLSIDRIDNNGNYCPENCRWATVHDQSNNKSNCVYTTYEGKTLSLGDWAREVGVRPETFRNYARKHSVADAIEHYRSCSWTK